jgi:serine phosphatase RsbU (regulator of sigma subunit)
MNTLRRIDPAIIGLVPLFAGIPATELEHLAATLEPTTFEPGTLLFREGDTGDHFYVVLAGSIAIIKALGTPDERLVGVRGVGEFVGEMSLLNTDGLRTASVRVYERADVLIFSRADFDNLLSRHPHLVYTMLKILSTRLRESHEAALHDLQAKNQQLAKAYVELQAAQAQLIEQETLAHELRLAHGIQMQMLPQTLPELPGAELGACMLPARSVGGDFYDVVPLGDDRLILTVADVSGKGMPAALYMGLASSLLNAQAAHAPTPEAAVRALNDQLLRREMGSMFVTVVYGVFELSTRTFSYVRAGHPAPVVLDAQGNDCSPGVTTGQPLGLFDDLLLDVQTVSVPPGGVLLLYSDGVTEAHDPSYELYGPERLLAAMREGTGLSAQVLCDSLLQQLQRYHGTAAQADDITLLALRMV